MKRQISVLGGIFLLCLGTNYALATEGAPYQGAGIGKEVSSEAKEIKTYNATKGEFGETVRERAREKTRIQMHKELRQGEKMKKNK